MARTVTLQSSSRILSLAAVAVVVAALYFAREVLMPMALAILFSFLLAPIVKRLERWAGRILSVVTVATFSFTFLIVVGWVVAGQLVELASKLPEYRGSITEKIRTLRGKSSALGEATHAIRELEKELKTPAERPVEAPRDKSSPATPPPSPQAAERTAVPVNIVELPSNPLYLIGDAVGALAGPLATTALVGLFVVFILIQREDLRDRFIRLTGQGQLNVTTDALDEAASRISRYLLMQLVVNATYGIPVAIGLYFIGVPNAFLWGLLATVLRYLPYLGPWLAAAMPIALSLAVGEWWQFGATVALYIMLELISNNIMEPWLYGASAGISPVALLAAATFWAWLWGAIGLLLATPLTVLLVVLGKYVPQLEFLHILLGDTPVLEPKTRFYQRLLAMDHDEPRELMEQFLKDMPRVEFYDSVLVPALVLAERDRHHGRLDPERHKFIQQTMLELIDELGKRKADEEKVKETQRLPAQSTKAEQKTIACLKEAAVLCIPASDEADQMTARMLSQILEENGFRAPTMPLHASAADMIAQITRSQTKVVCISALPPSALAGVRKLCRELHSCIPDLTIIVGLWSTRNDLAKVKQHVQCSVQDKTVATLADAAQQVMRLIEPIVTAQPKPA